MNIICRHFFVAGKVQGVYYRDSTCKKARELNITGWVRNRKDGKVELVACGEADKLNALEAWLWEGPALAKVEKVTAEEASIEQHSDFIIIPNYDS